MSMKLTPIDDLIPQIKEWGKKRGLHDNCDLNPQFIKLTEELGEIAAAIARDEPKLIIDGVGDMLVVLIQFGAVFDRGVKNPQTEFITDCLNIAWNSIKDRRGKTTNGMFIKELEQ